LLIQSNFFNLDNNNTINFDDIEKNNQEYNKDFIKLIESIPSITDLTVETDKKKTLHNIIKILTGDYNIENPEDSNKITKFKNIRFIISIFLIFFTLYLYSVGSLKGFAYLSQLNAEYNTTTIFKEFFILFSIFICSILLTSIFLNKETSFFRINNFIFFIPLFYLFFCFIVWIINAPSPRFAYGYFASLAPTIILASVKNNFLYDIKRENLIRNYIYFIMFILFFVEPIYKNVNNLDLNIRVIPKIDTVKREGFGVKVENFCWTEKNCYFYNYDLKFKYLLFNYKIFTK
jgi:hypothetical protein